VAVQRGFTLIELLIVVAIIGILMGIAVPMLHRAVIRAEISAIGAEAKTLYTAFSQHFIDQDNYPNASNAPAFKLDTFEPLVTFGYYNGKLMSKLQSRQADAYDSPDDQSSNHEFWLEMTLRRDPSIRFLVADSDNAPLSGGKYMNGIFLYQNGVLTPIHEPD
jgi:prepilin-type N-terminal cleavage/methylation domain-containing protein